MNTIFHIIYKLLMFIAGVTHLTYHEINIIVYYMITPFIFLFLLDKIFRFHYLKIIFGISVLLFFIIIHDFSEFSDRLFLKSQYFLESFGFMGLNYVGASVVICVVIPFILFVVLVWIVYKERIKNLFRKKG